MEEQVKHPEKKVKINIQMWLNMMAHSIIKCVNYIFCLVYPHSVMWPVEEILCC